MNYIKSASICILSLIFFCACNSKKPQPFLSTEDMIAIGMDLRMAEAYIGANYPAGTPDDSLKSVTHRIYTPIFAHYGLSLQNYRENVEYYLLKPQEMEEIQKAIAENLRTLATKETSPSEN